MLAGAKIVGFALQLIALRFHLKWLGQEQYGLFLLVQVWSAYLVLLDPNLSIGTQKRLTEALFRKDVKAVKSVVAFQLAGSFGIALVGAVVLVLYRAITGSTGGPSLTLVALGGTMYLATYLLTAYTSIFAAGERFSTVASLNLGQVFLSSVFSLVLVRQFGTVEWLAAGMAIGTLIPVLTAVIIARRTYFPDGWTKPDADTAKDISKLGLKSYGNRVSSVMASRSDRMVIGSTATTQLTMYAVACRVPELLCDVLSSLVQSAQPELTRAHAHNQDHFADLILRNNRLTLAVGCSFILLPAAFGHSIVTIWLGHNIPGVGEVMLCIGIYRTFELLYIGYTSAFYAIGNPERMFKFALFNAICTVTLSFPAYHYGGLLGIGLMNVGINCMQFFPITYTLHRHAIMRGTLRSLYGSAAAVLVPSLLVAGIAYSIDTHLLHGKEYLAIIIAPAISLTWMASLCATNLSPTPEPIRRLLRKLAR